MCGRYALSVILDIVLHRYKLDGVILDPLGDFSETGFVPRFNISPTEDALVVADTGQGKALRPMTWWLIAPWSKDGKPGAFKTFNARDDKLLTSKMYAPLLKRKRCLVPVTGFYEWTGAKGNKTPVYIQVEDEEISSLAGLWSHWRSKADDSEVYSFTVITTEPNDFLRPIHNRMPVILHRNDEDRWLDPGCTDAEALTELLIPYSGPMKAHAVSKAVNAPGNDSPELIQPVESGEGF